MHDRDRRDAVIEGDVVDDIWETPQRSFADVVHSERVLLGIHFDGVERVPYGAGELVSESGTTSFIPLECFLKICASGITKSERPHRSGTTALELVKSLLPRNPEFAVRSELSPAPPKLRGLHVVRLNCFDRQTVPELFGEFHALVGRQVAEIRESRGHSAISPFPDR
jgi:hypothetical protein